MILKPSFDRVESQELDIKKFIEMLNFFKSLVDQSSDQVTYGLDLSRTPLLRDSYYRDQDSSIFKLPLSSDKHDKKTTLELPETESSLNISNQAGFTIWSARLYFQKQVLIFYLIN
jgi:hypothetical protein